MKITLSVKENRIIYHNEHSEINVEDELFSTFKSYNQTYQDIKQRADNGRLLSLGKQLFKSLDTILSLDKWLNSTNIRTLEIVSSLHPNELEILLLSLPWEIMATDNRGFLAQDRQLLEVIRRIGFENQEAPEAKYSDITLAFMASDPNLESGLEYEKEERIILEAAQKYRNINLLVDESGNLVTLENRLFTLGHCDMVHLSSHGYFNANDDFILLLEDDRFNVQEAKAEDFRMLANTVQALFLSACHSAEFKNTPPIT